MTRAISSDVALINKLTLHVERPLLPPEDVKKLDQASRNNSAAQ
jgi:hypothetical protein